LGCCECVRGVSGGGTLNSTYADHKQGVELFSEEFDRSKDVFMSGEEEIQRWSADILLWLGKEEMLYLRTFGKQKLFSSPL